MFESVIILKGSLTGKYYTNYWRGWWSNDISEAYGFKNVDEVLKHMDNAEQETDNPFESHKNIVMETILRRK